MASPNHRSFLIRMRGISRDIKTGNRPEVKPEFFSMLQPHLNVVEESYRQMFNMAVHTLLGEKADAKSIIDAVNRGRKNPDFQSVSKSALAGLRDSGLHPGVVDRIGQSASEYLSALHTLDYLRGMSEMHPAVFGRFLNSRRTRSELGLHVTEFSRIFDVATAFSNFKFELERFKQTYPFMNGGTPDSPGIRIPGFDHHFGIGRKLAFLGAHPSVYGGDNLHVEDLSNGKFFISLVDLSGHAEEHRTGINHVRNWLIGNDAGLLAHVSKEKFRNRAYVRRFLQSHSANVNNFLEQFGVNATAIFGVFDSKTKEFHYINAGHDDPVVYSPETQEQVAVNHSHALLLGFLSAKPEDYDVHTIRLDNPGAALHLRTDGLHELPSSSGKDVDRGEEMNQKFIELMKEGHSAESATHVLFQHAENLGTGLPWFEDDTRSFILINNKTPSRFKRAFDTVRALARPETGGSSLMRHALATV